MALTTAQLTTLKAFVQASADAGIIAAAQSRNDTELARLLNLPSTFSVWRSTTPAASILDVVVWSSFTPTDAPDGNAIYTNRVLVCGLKRDNLWLLLARDSVPTATANAQKTLSDALQNVPGGAAGALLDAGWLGAGKVKAAITRLATVAETAFTTGTGTAGQPGQLGWEGTVTIDDIGTMWNL